MSTTSNWINNLVGSLVGQTGFAKGVVLTRTQALALPDTVNEITATSLLFGDATKWLLSLKYYPITFYSGVANNYDTLVAGGVTYHNNNQFYAGTLPSYALQGGYTLGEYAYPAAESFLDYEPYTVAEVYLPYYGYAKLKIADVQGKYIQFRMYVDFQTGVAQHVVGVSASSIESPNAPYAWGTDDSGTRILATYSFQLGHDLPITSEGWINASRNIIMAGAKAAVSIASGGLLSGIPTGSGTSEATVKTTERNPATGRQITTGTERVSSTHESYTNYAHRGANTAIETGFTALSCLAATPANVSSNDTVLNLNTSQSVKVIRRKSLTTQTSYFENLTLNHLRGLPLGDTYTLSSLSGFTTVSDIHLEGSAFAKATSTEMNMIKQALGAGVIL